jgi:hypothetical protein
MQVLDSDDARRVQQLLLARGRDIARGAADRRVTRPAAIASRGAHENDPNAPGKTGRGEAGTRKALVIGMGKAEKQRARHQ